MKTLTLFTSVSALTLLIAISSPAASRLLPFQGRLTDANGAAIADGARTVQFKIYDAPVGGRAVWNGEVQKLTVNGGLVSTILGTKSSLGNVDFNQDLYLEITLDANADGNISLSDPPLLPRQSILPAVFSYEAANARELEGYNWSALFGTNNPAEGTLLPAKIANASITTGKIADNAITAAKIADGAVLRSKIDAAGAGPGNSLVYNGTQVVWSPVNSVNSDLLDGFDWSHLFNNANPTSGQLSVASLTSRGSLRVNGSTIFDGQVQMLGHCILRTTSSFWLGDQAIYLRALGDFNHGMFYGNIAGDQSGFDGPIIIGVGGGVLGTGGNYTLRWNANGTVRTRGTITQGSDRNIKENFEEVSREEVLAKVLGLPISRWNYKDDPTSEHIGPVSQDFRAAFGLGSDDKTIAMVDADGIALAAIQGLNKKVEQENAELRVLIKTQQEQIERLRVRQQELDELKAEFSALKAGRK